MQLSKSISKLSFDHHSYGNTAPQDHHLPHTQTHMHKDKDKHRHIHPQPPQPSLAFPLPHSLSLSQSPTVNIKNIDYEFLEEKFQMHKYYPQYIHNQEISTPVLRDLIVDKPIYADANKHVKRGIKQKKKNKQNQKPSETLKESRRLRREQKEEFKTLKKENRQEQKELKREHREERRELRNQQKENKQSYNGHFMQKVNSLSTANGGSNQTETNAGQCNPYQMKTRYGQGLGIGSGLGLETDMGMSKSNSENFQMKLASEAPIPESEFIEFHNPDNNTEEEEEQYKREGDVGYTYDEDSKTDCAPLDHTYDYDSEKTEVEDDFNPLAFKNPFNVANTTQIAPPTTSMSKSSSLSIDNGHNHSYGYGYSYGQGQGPKSRNNSINFPNLTMMQTSHLQIIPNRRSSSITLLNNSQNASLNRHNSFTGNHNTAMHNVGSNKSHNSTTMQTRKSSSLTNRFMNMFTRDNNDSQNCELQEDTDNPYTSFGDFSAEHSSGGGELMNRKGSVVLHKPNQTINYNLGNSLNAPKNEQAKQQQQLLQQQQQQQQQKSSQFSFYPLEKSSSFDQTKSAKTSLKNKLKMKLSNETGRRYSEQFGMYLRI